jgi:hypothetical protein
MKVGPRPPSLRFGLLLPPWCLCWKNHTIVGCRKDSDALHDIARLAGAFAGVATGQSLAGRDEAHFEVSSLLMRRKRRKRCKVKR